MLLEVVPSALGSSVREANGWERWKGEAFVAGQGRHNLRRVTM